MNRHSTHVNNVDYKNKGIPDDTPFCPEFTPDMKPEQLPCKGCHYCQRAHRTWDKFLHELDEAVSLTKIPRQVKSKNKPVIEPGTALVKLFGENENTEYQEIDNAIFSTELDLYMIPDFQQIQVQSSDFARVMVISGDEGVSLKGFTSEEIRDAQNDDPNLKFILKWLREKEEPQTNELFLASPAAKSFWINRQMFFLNDQDILKNKPKQESRQNRLVVPEKFKPLVMELSHELPTAGHQGTERTMTKIKERYHWYNMSSDVRSFVLTCDICSKNKKPTRRAKCPMTLFHSGAPMERVHLDFMGPFPKSKLGNEYILMIVDQFTKWTECIPLPNQTAEVTAQAAINEFFARFGYPFEIFTDQGRNFESALFKAVCELLQIHKARTTPYRPSANGQVERQNSTLMNSVRCFVSRSQDNWDVHIPQLAGAIRSCVNRSTGYTPNRLMLGRETYQPTDLMFGMAEEKRYSGVDEYIVELETAIRRSHEIARKTLNTTQANMKRDFDIRTWERSYKKGDLIYVFDPATVKGKCKKLSSPWKGPGVIIQKKSDYLYQVKMQRLFFTTNHDMLKVCKDRRIPAWLQDCQKRVLKGEDVLQKPINDKTGKTVRKYCICQGPDTGDMMVCCDQCKEWFHIKCVKLTPEEAQALEEYICPKCTKSNMSDSEKEVKRSWQQERRQNQPNRTWEQLADHLESRLLEERAPPTGGVRSGGHEVPGQYEDALEERDRALALQFEKEERQKTFCKGSVQVARNSPCPVAGCPVSDRKMKKHVIVTHLNHLFSFTSFQKDSDEFHRCQIDMARTLARWVIGPRGTVRELLDFVNRRARIPLLSVIPPEAVPSLRRLAEVAGWRQPQRLSLGPVNTCALLMYWRVGVSLLHFLNLEQRQRLHAMAGPASPEVALIPAGAEGPDMDDVVCRSVLMQSPGKRRLVDLTVSSIQELKEVVRERFPDVFIPVQIYHGLERVESTEQLLSLKDGVKLTCC